MDSPVGVILAGGRGRRIGGAKASVSLCGRPLIAHPLAVLREVLADVAVLTKEPGALPELPAGVGVWEEPEPYPHPVIGLRRALKLAEGRAILACAVDLPLITPGTIERLAQAPPPGVIAALASTGGELQPLLGRYEPGALVGLSVPGSERAPLRDTVRALGALAREVEDVDDLFNVNTAEDLAWAAQILQRRAAQPNVKS